MWFTTKEMKSKGFIFLPWSGRNIVVMTWKWMSMVACLFDVCFNYVPGYFSGGHRVRNNSLRVSNLFKAFSVLGQKCVARQLGL